MLAELYAHVEPSGWRISDRPGRDTRRARAWLGEDLDALEEFTQEAAGQSGAALKVSAVGPWTLAAGAGAAQRRGDARRPAGPAATWPPRSPRACAHIWPDVRRRVPGATLVLQLDEPSLTSVLRGQRATASGYRTHRGRGPRGGRGHAAGAVRGARTARRGALLRSRRPVRAAAPGGRRRDLASTPRCSPSVTTRRSARPSRAARALRGCRAVHRPGDAHCQTLPVASGVSGRCGAGSGCPRGLWPSPSWSPPRAVSRAPRPRTRARRSPTASRRQITR